MSSFEHLTQDLGAVLAAYSPSEPDQQRLRAAYADHLRTHPGAVAKAGPPAHFTASCLVVDPGVERVLLTHHRRARQWFQFGGHLEATDLGVHAAAQREAREESGLPDLVALPQPIQLDRHTLAGDFGRCREHLDIRFVAVAEPGAEPVVSAESFDVRWWPGSALPADTDRSLVALVVAARRALAATAAEAR
ncbi:MAG: NUDIX domain-containing protein [Nostocoides sp.]